VAAATAEAAPTRPKVMEAEEKWVAGTAGESEGWVAASVGV
jgi:hypothetical protein